MTTNKRGKTAGVTPPGEAPAAGTDRGGAAVEAEAGPIEPATDHYTRSVAIGRAFIARYRRTLAALAK